MQHLSTVYYRNKYLSKDASITCAKLFLKPEVLLSYLFQEFSLAHWETTFCSKIVQEKMLSLGIFFSRTLGQPVDEQKESVHIPVTHGLLLKNRNIFFFSKVRKSVSSCSGEFWFSCLCFHPNSQEKYFKSHNEKKILKAFEPEMIIYFILSHFNTYLCPKRKYFILL